MNCLINDTIANVGIGLPTTHMLNYYKAGEGLVVCRDKDGCPLRKASLEEFRKEPHVPDRTTWIMHELPNKECLEDNTIIDTPGLDSVGAEASIDNESTADIIRTVGCVVLVLPNKQLTAGVRGAILPKLKEVGVPVIAVVNCMPNGLGLNASDPGSSQNKMVVRHIEEELRSEGVIPCMINEEGAIRVLACNVVWWWLSNAPTLEGTFFDEQTKGVFYTRMQETTNLFTLFGKPVPSADELAERSRLGLLMEFLRATDNFKREVISRNRVENNPIPTLQRIHHDLSMKVDSFS